MIPPITVYGPDRNPEVDLVNALPFATLVNAVGWEPRSGSDMQRALSRTLAYAIAWDRSTPVGAVRLIGDGIYAVAVYDLVVHPDHQRAGIGTALLAAVTDASPVAVECVAAPGADGFYDAAGWSPVRCFRREPT